MKEKKKIFIKNVFKKKNFSEILNYVAVTYPDDFFLVKDNIFLTFRNFNFKVNQTCNFLKKKKIKKKSVISLYLENSLEFVILYFAIIRLGCIVSPIPYGVSREKIKYYLKISKSHLLISNKKLINKNNFVIRDYTYFDSLIKKSDIEFRDEIKNDKLDCVYYFSSGTTANPKVIRYSHKAMVNCQKLLYESNFLDLFARHLCILPLGHTASLRYTIKNAIFCAGRVYLQKNFWEIKDQFWKIIKNRKIQFVGVVPSIVEAIYALYKSSSPCVKKNIKFLGCGSSILRNDLQKKFFKKFNINIRNIYGMSEIGVATMDDPGKHKIFGTIGKPLKGIRIKLLDQKNREIKKNDYIGEIAVKTPSLFNGYLDSSGKKTKVVKEKYFKTGDLAKRRNGNFIFVDRSKDIIIKGGVNISPQEIDDCLMSNRFIKESKTIGVKDKFFGEKIKSFIVLCEKSKLTKFKIIEFCKKKIGNFRSPNEVIFLDKLPKTPSGKVVNRLLE